MSGEHTHTRVKLGVYQVSSDVHAPILPGTMLVKWRYVTDVASVQRELDRRTGIDCGTVRRTVLEALLAVCAGILAGAVLVGTPAVLTVWVYHTPIG